MTTVTHDQARAWLHEGRSRLSAQEQAELDEHLAGCGECRGYGARVAALEPALTRAMRAQWDGVRPPAMTRRVSEPLAAGARRAPARAWLTSLLVTGGLTVLAALALAGPGAWARLGLAVAPGTATTSAPTAPPATAAGPARVQALLLAATVDQKRLLLQPIDPVSLDDLPGYAPIDLGQNAYPTALAPDGRRWAAVVWPGDPSLTQGALHLIDTQAWRDVATSVVFSDSVHDLVFSPDGSVLAATEIWNHVDGSGRQNWGGTLRLIHVDQPDQVTAVPIDLYPQRLAFSPDGVQVVLYGTPWPDCQGAAGCFATGMPSVTAIDAATGRTLWAVMLSETKDGEYREPTTTDPQRINFYTPGLAFAPDGRWLYLVPAQADELTLVDLALGATHTQPLTRPAAWLDRLLSVTAGTAYAKGGPEGGADKYAALSADGTRLYVTGWQRQVKKDANVLGGILETYTAPAPEVIDPRTGSRLSWAEQALAGEGDTQILPSPDGRWLYLSRQSTPSANGDHDPALPGLKILDAATLKPVAQTGTGLVDALVTFAPGADRAYLFFTEGVGGATDVQALRASDGQLLARRKIGAFGTVVVLPP